MSSKLVFLYDGECPFCNHFSELLELRSALPEITIKNARENLSEMKALLERGYDLDNGAILLKGEEVLHGASAINFIDIDSAGDLDLFWGDYFQRSLYLIYNIGQ